MTTLCSNDKALADRLLSGEEPAYEELFEMQVPRLYRFALSRLDGDAETAEDIVQATLCKVMQKLHTYRGEATLLTWLCTFCYREISAHYRRLGRSPKPVELSEDLPAVATALDLLQAGRATGPEEQTLRQEVGRLVQVTLDRLPGRYGDVLEWKYIEGLSVKEIATRLETGPTAVQSLLARARDAFRDGFAALGKAPLRSPLRSTGT